MNTFEQLAASRRHWIDSVLKTWCEQAPLKELKLAEAEWTNVAGDVGPDSTLWVWAWRRFPTLVNEHLNALDEAYEVRVTLKNGTSLVGFPDNRNSRRGQLVLVLTSADGDPESPESGPCSIDDVASVKRVEA